MSITSYLEKVGQHYQSGHATEHTYRGDFAELVKTLTPNIHITNEPSNVTDCGNPDYVITRNKIPVGFIEAKDLGKDLNSKQYKEQFGRYRKALDNLIITDYIWFQFFQNGELAHEIRIADIDGKHIKPLPVNFAKFTNLLHDFCTFIAQTIKSPKTLAQMMAGKARLLENILRQAITSDEENEDNSALKQQYETFKNILIHDLSPQGFADIYAQTLAYGMFAARLHDKTLDTFSRQEAAELIPKSNPFLRKLFSHVAGVDIDERIVTTVDNLADVFRATNVEALLKNFGKSTQTQDPIIHFYETFLAEYDPKLRKARGVWYTPEPVVNFIVRGVDELLKTEFGLKDGLADTTRTKVKVKTDKPDRRTKSGYVEIEKEVHKVQVLDPATGTGTFLAEVVKYIYSKKFQAMKGAWSGYVEEHLIPRLNGFELLMASYAMAHLKLDMLLSETGYQSQKNPRFNIFLTNSLEEYHPDTGTLFSSWLSTEANEANNIKRDTPVMVVMGNPPYSGESANKGKWIMDLMEDYKKEPGGKEKLKERNPKWINDDYVKFIRFGQHFIEQNGEGVLAYINPHGFLDNPTFRGMRWNLLNTYDKIYTIDLHGNSKKKEVSPDGSPDINVFDIEQGVSINFFVKTGKEKSNELAQVFHYDLFGAREFKYKYLRDNTLSEVPFNKLPNIEPMYFMVSKDFSAEEEYKKGVSLDLIFSKKNIGIVTGRDKLVISDKKGDLEKRINDIFVLNSNEAKSKHSIKESKSWNINDVKSKEGKFKPELLKEINYRPFDKKYIYYNDSFIERSRKDVMQNYEGDNIGLLTTKSFKDKEFSHLFVTNSISEAIFLSGTTASNAINIPLWLVKPDRQKEMPGGNKDKVTNLSEEYVKQLCSLLKIPFNDDVGAQESFSSIDIFDYIYAVLSSKEYRQKYNEFLKIDYPYIPYPSNKETFFNLAKQGGQLRQLHLMESKSLESFISTYPISGSNKVTNKINDKDWEIYDKENQMGRIWINKDQYFEGVPLKVWEFYIGGYQPAQKWLKDRSGCSLSFDDILHYQKIIVALHETDRIMQAIDEIDLE